MDVAVDKQFLVIIAWKIHEMTRYGCFDHVVHLLLIYSYSHKQ
jgi:hypothetical protein